jgi:RAB protein geranylgeranyltransferase component A
MSVPCSKSEIFSSPDLGLLDKQKLLTFIYTVMKVKTDSHDVNTTIDIKKDYEIPESMVEDFQKNQNLNAEEFLKQRYSEELQSIIKLVLANMDPNCSTQKTMTVDQLFSRIFKYLSSLQVYDSSPFLYPIYGSSEFSQGLCRVSSVYGSIFIVTEFMEAKLHSNNESFINSDAPKYVISFNDKSIFYVKIF